jgi:hypothetical protein
MLNENDKKSITYNKMKNERLRNKILKKIINIQKKINEDYNLNNNIILKNKLSKLKNILNNISMTPKEKNRNKEIKRINFRVHEYEKELSLLNNHIQSEHIESVKILGKINKLIRRRNTLETHTFSKKPTRNSPSLIRYYLRKYREIDKIIT